jgi:sulfur carrier protein
MTFTVNGAPHESAAEDLLTLWREYTAPLELPGPQGFAIALNGSVVRQRDWESRRLIPGDRVEIIRALSGG